MHWDGDVEVVLALSIRFNEIPLKLKTQIEAWYFL